MQLTCIIAITVVVIISAFILCSVIREACTQLMRVSDDTRNMRYTQHEINAEKARENREERDGYR